MFPPPIPHFSIPNPGDDNGVSTTVAVAASAAVIAPLCVASPLFRGAIFSTYSSLFLPQIWAMATTILTAVAAVAPPRVFARPPSPRARLHASAWLLSHLSIEHSR
uniref:Uncharacterized protein n=1 Tax=Leersia perrieri TaxID=77586 RepID=A0A0D9VMG5_9ORYZ